jgi:hypothetical protein
LTARKGRFRLLAAAVLVSDASLLRRRLLPAAAPSAGSRLAVRRVPPHSSISAPRIRESRGPQDLCGASKETSALLRHPCIKVCLCHAPPDPFARHQHLPLLIAFLAPLLFLLREGHGPPLWSGERSLFFAPPACHTANARVKPAAAPPRRHRRLCAQDAQQGPLGAATAPGRRTIAASTEQPRCARLAVLHPGAREQPSRAARASRPRLPPDPASPHANLPMCSHTLPGRGR